MLKVSVSRLGSNRRKVITGFVGALALAISVVLAGAGSATAGDLDDPSLPLLSAEEIDLLSSGDPITVTIDAATGELTSVEATPVTFAPLGVTKNDCSGGKACWYGWLSPHAYYGFDGTGATGTWPNRGTFYSRDYYAKPCWLSGTSTVCSSAYLPPNTTALFAQELTGKRVYLYS